MSNPETTLCWHPLQQALNELRQTCLRAQDPPPHWERIENMGVGGVPDLNWHWENRGGWIELKHRYDLPKKDDTPVTLDTITAQQRLWWRQRWESGGSVYVLLRLANQWLLFPGWWAAFNLGNVSYQSLLDHAVYVAERGELDAVRVMEASWRG